jgi:hypothetical protein
VVGRNALKKINGELAIGIAVLNFRFKSGGWFAHFRVFKFIIWLLILKWGVLKLILIISFFLNKKLKNLFFCDEHKHHFLKMEKNIIKNPQFY